MNLGRRLQTIDRRGLYLLLMVIVGLPFVPGVTIPVPAPAVLPQTRAYYDTIENVARDEKTKGQLVILATNYGAGTMAENQTQFEATAKHLVRHRMKIALLSFIDPQGRDLGQRAFERIAAKAGYEYGKDWCNIGYRPADGFNQVMLSAASDLPGTFGTDIRGARLADLPVMQGTKSADDIALAVNFASTASLPIWLQFFPKPNKERLTLLYAPTSVMAPEAFPLLRSGQLQGMLIGLKGSIEYEGLIRERGFATRASASLSYAHFLIIVLVALGNVGMFLERRRRGG